MRVVCGINVDVLICGGGPAGTAAALTILRYSALSVAVVEASDYQPARVGETVSPGLKPLLEYLGVWDSFAASGHLRACATSAAWGSPGVLTRDFLFTGRGEGWHLDRRHFDRMLADQVVERGGSLLTGTRVVDARRDPEGHWQVAIARNCSRTELTARFVVDASGKSAWLARRFGARREVYDHLAGVVGFHDVADGPTRPQVTLVEACPDGWWYSAPLPDGRMVTAFMSDTDVVRQRGAHRPGVWRAMLAETQHTREWVGNGKLHGPLQVRPAQSHLLQPSAGAGWIAAGDAVASFDPLASMGIGHAVSSGIHAARVAHDVLTSDGALLAPYTEGTAQNFEQYLTLRQRYYRLEQRWSDRPFWARRQQFT